MYTRCNRNFNRNSMPYHGKLVDTNRFVRVGNSLSLLLSFWFSLSIFDCTKFSFRFTFDYIRDNRKISLSQCVLFCFVLYCFAEDSCLIYVLSVYIRMCVFACVYICKSQQLNAQTITTRYKKIKLKCVYRFVRLNSSIRKSNLN